MAAKPASSFGRQALHAARLALVHPMTAEACRWESPLPEDFEALLAALRARGATR
jgi:23S rRNA pseudouridine1911/1915/1917 synthase